MVDKLQFVLPRDVLRFEDVQTASSSVATSAGPSLLYPEIASGQDACSCAAKVSYPRLRARFVFSPLSVFLVLWLLVLDFIAFSGGDDEWLVERRMNTYDAVAILRVAILDSASRLPLNVFSSWTLHYIVGAAPKRVTWWYAGIKGMVMFLSWILLSARMPIRMAIIGAVDAGWMILVWFFSPRRKFVAMFTIWFGLFQLFMFWSMNVALKNMSCGHGSFWFLCGPLLCISYYFFAGRCFNILWRRWHSDAPAVVFPMVSALLIAQVETMRLVFVLALAFVNLQSDELHYALKQGCLSILTSVVVQVGSRMRVHSELLSTVFLRRHYSTTPEMDVQLIMRFNYNYANIYVALPMIMLSLCSHGEALRAEHWWIWLLLLLHQLGQLLASGIVLVFQRMLRERRTGCRESLCSTLSRLSRPYEHDVPRLFCRLREADREDAAISLDAEEPQGIFTLSVEHICGIFIASYMAMFSLMTMSTVFHYAISRSHCEDVVIVR